MAAEEIKQSPLPKQGNFSWRRVAIATTVLAASYIGWKARELVGLGSFYMWNGHYQKAVEIYINAGGPAVIGQYAKPTNIPSTDLEEGIANCRAAAAIAYKTKGFSLDPVDARLVLAYYTWIHLAYLREKQELGGLLEKGVLEPSNVELIAWEAALHPLGKELELRPEDTALKEFIEVFTKKKERLEKEQELGPHQLQDEPPQGLEGIAAVSDTGKQA